MITITSGGSRFCGTGRGPWCTRVQGGYTIPEGTSEGVCLEHSERHRLQAYMWKRVNCLLNCDVNN